MEPINRAAGWIAAQTPSEPLEGRRQSLIISEAALACGVNRRTIRRHREAGDFPGMFKDVHGAWRILVSDLEAAGYPPLLIARLDEPTEATQLDRLRGEVAVLRARLQATERVARERQDRIEDLRLVLRMLPAAWAERLGNMASDPPAEPPAIGLDPLELARAEAAWAETRRLRDRLDRELLAKEAERLVTRRLRRLARR